MACRVRELLCVRRNCAQANALIFSNIVSSRTLRVYVVMFLVLPMSGRVRFFAKKSEPRTEPGVRSCFGLGFEPF